MRLINTTKETQRKAETLSMFLYGEITNTCKHYISAGNYECLAWVKRLCDRYNVLV